MADQKISQLTASTTPLAGTEVLPVVQSSTTKKVSVSNLTAGRAVAGLSFTATNACAAGGAYGFVSSNYQANAKNPVWSFGDAPAYGISYFQGSSGISNLDTIGFHFGTDTAAGSPFQFRSDGVFKANSQIQTNENFRVGLAGNGLLLSANTPAAGMTSQLLNWYEEGTWAPTDASGAGLTFTVAFAKYIRVGKQVTVNMFITFPSTASAAQATIGGLPFSVASGNYPPPAFASNSGTALGGFANATAKTVSIGTAADYSVAVTNLTLSGRNLVMSLTYLVD